MLKRKNPNQKRKKFSLCLSLFFPQKVARAENIVDEQKEIQASEICENKKSTASSPTDWWARQHHQTDEREQ